MRILITGSDYIWSIERLYKKYLQEAGAMEVEMFSAQNLFYTYYQRSIINKLIFRTGLSGIFGKINNLFIKEIDRFRPDIIWIFKGMEILPETLELCRRKGILLVNFNGDNPFIFTGSGSGNKNVFQALPLFDLHLTYNLEIKERLDREYKLKTAMLPFGFDVTDVVFEKSRQQDEIRKICFLGNPDRIRAGFIEKLAAAGLQVDIYGGKEWKEMVSHSSIRLFPPVYGDEFWSTLRKYRVQLNLMRVHNENSHNMRSFEVPGIGGIMLAPDTTEHRLFFKNGEEAFLFSDADECIQMAKQLLALNEEDAEKIRVKARRRSLEDGYSYKERSKYALKQFEKLYAQAGHPSF